MNKNNNSPHVWLEVFLLFMLAGCAVGPDFQRPAPPDVTGYISGSNSYSTIPGSTTRGVSQNIIEAQQVSSYWWRELGSAKLNDLISEALRNNPSLSAAEATLRQAQELYLARQGSTLYPQIEGILSGQRQRSNPGALGQSGEARVFNLYTASTVVQYTFDLAGGNRRALEALAARSDYQRFQLVGARLTLTANIATTAIMEARFLMQIEALESIVRSQEEQLALAWEQVRLGHRAPNDVLALQTQVEQTRAGTAQVRNQFQQNEHLLATLVGRPPGAGLLPSFSLDDFAVPSDLPMLVPSELVRARPDILGAEALMHAANAEYGVAISKLYPQINISGNLGSQALTAGALFGSGSATWSLVGQLTQPLFNPGLPAEKRAALAAFEAAAANYQTVVLTSLRNVADALRALENDSERFITLSAAYEASRKFLNSAQHQYAFGAASYYDLFLAQQELLRIQVDLIEAQAKRLINTVAFYEAMGGGIPSHDEPVASSR